LELEQPWDTKKRALPWCGPEKTESASARSPEDCWLPKWNSMRTRPGWIEPEIYFGIVHLAHDVHSGAPVAAYRKQTVKIALGPKGVHIPVIPAAFRSEATLTVTVFA
jgi:hypothetical protein